MEGRDAVVRPVAPAGLGAPPPGNDGLHAVSNMRTRIFKTMDANEAVAGVAYKLNEVIAIYPITPASPMGEWADAWAAAGLKNLWGAVPSVVEMQSEGGASGAVHGALQVGSLSTTFTASQGLLLMLPNLCKIAGELTPTVFHIAARSLAAQALSIFGDHSDVMAARFTGFAMLGSASVQEAQDFALIAQAATLESRIPFLHFFDGFRTSHEVSKIEPLADAVLRDLISEARVLEHHERALSPDWPVVRGTAQNPDIYFQARETVNPYYSACPEAVQRAMDRFAELTGRQYRLFEYHGAPDAERVVVLMGSGCEAAHETVDYLNAGGEKVGVLKVRLYRPFDIRRMLAAVPATTRRLAVLDRTKEPGSAGEPLYLDCVHAVYDGICNRWAGFQEMPLVVGGRYGLSSKEFTPGMVKAVFDNLLGPKPKNHFTVGIRDDVGSTSLDFDPGFSLEPAEVFRATFYGLGSDGTVGANKDSIKIIGEHTDHYAQGYFVYDSKKSGAVTVSHLRFGPRPIRSTYLIVEPNFVGCHQPGLLERHDLLAGIAPGGTFLLNSPFAPDQVWERLPSPVQRRIQERRVRLFVIDAHQVARDCGMGGRINTIMQVCFFSLSNVLPQADAIEAVKASIRKTYGRKGEAIVRMNLAAVDQALAHLHEVQVPDHASGRVIPQPEAPDEAPAFVRDVLRKIIAGRGDEIPVSFLPEDGTYPTGTTRWEKRNLAAEIPVWEPEVCIQCGKCVFVCPHAAIRSKVYPPDRLAGAPATFRSRDARLPEWKGLKYTLQVAPEDCTGCGLCVEVCPARNKAEAGLKAINLQAQPPLLQAERGNWNFFLGLPEFDRCRLRLTSVREQQVQQPLFEFSGACAGCGETPYLKLLSQLFGDRLLVANATGCSSIYGGNLPTTPWTCDAEGRGPAWSNSLFEDNAEFGLGFRVALDHQREFAGHLLEQLAPTVGDDLAGSILTNPQADETAIARQRQAVGDLKRKLAGLDSDDARRLFSLAGALVRKSVWVVGGDGWAYDIGFGGLDHVLSTGRNVKVLVLDTEVYSNTGGQMSKGTPRGAVARFASSGRKTAKKDLGLMAMTYGHVYVAAVAMGAKDEHTLKAFLEAEAYHGPALIIAYCHCIAHGINMTTGMQDQKAAVQSGQWLLYRFDPERAKHGQNPLQLDSAGPKTPLDQYFLSENRFKMLVNSRPEEARRLFGEARDDAEARWQLYRHLAARQFKPDGHPATAAPAPSGPATQP
jgi:pyruvate-ferredoxin/flavodoxin oxidoreductase